MTKQHKPDRLSEVVEELARERHKSQERMPSAIKNQLDHEVGSVHFSTSMEEHVLKRARAHALTPASLWKREVAITIPMMVGLVAVFLFIGGMLILPFATQPKAASWSDRMIVMDSGAFSEHLLMRKPPQ